MADIKNISFDNGIKKIEVNDVDGNHITTLLINTADATTVKRFVELANNLEDVVNSGEDKIAVYKEKYKEYEHKEFDDLPDDVKTNIIVDASDMHIGILEGMIREIDALFGKDTIKNVFHECYELNENFVPDEDALVDFVNTVMPVMNELFKTRTEARRRHNKSKNQLIQEHKDAKKNE